MIVVAGYVTVRPVFNLSRLVRKAIPNGFTFAIFVPRAFDLKRGSRRSPVEALWEA